MTTETELKAGRELDGLVAEKVMGLLNVRKAVFSQGNDCFLFGPAGGLPMDVPFYSTDIGAAWEVLEKLHEDGWCIDIRIDDEPWDSTFTETYSVSLLGCNHGRTDATDIWEGADTVPLAICLAALKAVES